MINQHAADILQEIGDILEIRGEDAYRMRAYQNAALSIRNLSTDLEKIYNNDYKNLLNIPGIGESLAKKIEEIIKTGDSKIHKKLIKEFDKHLLTMLQLRTVGPKKIKLFYKTLNINSLAKLKKAAEQGKIRELPRMGGKSESEILKAIEEFRRFHKRTPLNLAEQKALEIKDYLKKFQDIEKVEIAGSLRRKKETIGDLDILAVTKNYKKLMDYFINFADTTKVIAKGDTKSSILLTENIQCDLMVVPRSSFGAAFYYFTGSKEHNIAIRDMAKRKGLKINEYGVFKNNKKIAGKTEMEIFKSVGLPYIIPEMRENEGEIEAALKGKLPKVIDLKDLKGDVHVHTDWSDGRNSLGEMIASAQKYGLKYIAITDHSPAVRVAGGLTKERILNQIQKINEIRKKFKNIRILTGMEVDIKLNSELDMDEEILKKLDIVIGSIHSHFMLSEEEQTKRVIKALKNPYLKIYGHPTCKMINRREPIKLNIEKIIKAAKEFHTALELNSQPLRLDLQDKNLRIAKNIGAKIVINSDSHSVLGFDNLRFGISTAKRGWIEKKDVLNTLEADKLLEWLLK